MNYEWYNERLNFIRTELFSLLKKRLNNDNSQSVNTEYLSIKLGYK